MSGDEVLVLVVSLILALLLWGKAIYEASRVRSCPSSTSGERTVAVGVPVLCAGALYYVLRNYASHDVRDSTAYTAFYMLMGAAWVAVAMRVWGWLGISTRDDLIERGNVAAAFAVFGALIAITFCFAGGNVGDGPGWWVVVFAAVLSTGTLFVLWSVLQKLSGVGEAITVDRDPASGLRAAGYLIASGVILGRAVAGNWVSVDATLVDFAALGWPALVIFALALVIERLLRPTPQAPRRSPLLFGLPVFLSVIAASSWYLRIKS